MITLLSDLKAAEASAIYNLLRENAITALIETNENGESRSILIPEDELPKAKMCVSRYYGESLPEIEKNDITEEIRYSSENPENLDLESYPQLDGMYKMTRNGMVLTVIIYIFSLISHYGSDYYLTRSLCDLLIYTPFVAWCYQTKEAIKKRKPSALLALRSLLIYCVLTWIFGFISRLSSDQGISVAFCVFGILICYWCLSSLYNSYTDEEIQSVFPENYRKNTVNDWISIIAYMLIPLIPLFLISNSIIY